MPDQVIPAPAVTFHQGRLQVIRSPHRPNLTTAIPQAQGHKSRRDGTRWWTVPYADASAAVKWADLHGLPVDDTVRTFIIDQWRRELRNTAQATATAPISSNTTDITGLRSELLPAQEAAVELAANAWVREPSGSTSHRAVVIADEMGLGKTITALAILRTPKSESTRTVIVCPSGLTSNWVNEIEQHFEPETIHPWIATTKSPIPVPTDIDTVVIGWEILPDWLPTLNAWSPDAVVADEAHYSKSGMLTTKEETRVAKGADGKAIRDDKGNLVLERTQKKTGGSARASALLDLADTARKRSGLILALTGTPIINRPLELLALLQVAGLMDMFGGSAAFQNRYCGPTTKLVKGRETKSFNGATNLAELNSRLTASGHFLRRRKRTLIDKGELMPKIVDGTDYYDHSARRQPWIIRATQEHMAPYRAAEGDTRAFFTGVARQEAEQRQQGINSPDVRRGVRAAGNKNLKRIAALRQAAAMVKIPYIVAWAKQQAEAGEKVVIAAHHKPVVDAYAAAFTGLKIQGGMGPQKIENAKRMFNETSAQDHPVLVLSVDAGKTGHTLCKQHLHGAGPACALMIFAEQVWTPGDEAQAQDRIWRIGQNRQVRIVNALLEGSIDAYIYGLRARKRAIVDAAIDAVKGVPPNAENVANADSERDGVAQLTESLVYDS